MKALHITKIYPPDSMGGVEQFIKSLSLETTQLGVSNTVLTLSNQQRQDFVGDLHVIRYPRNFEIASCPFSFSYFQNFKRIAKTFDVLHFHYPWPFAELTYLLRGVDRPALVTFHADALKHKKLRKIYQPLQQHFFKAVQAIVPTSTPQLESSPDLADFKAKCQVIPLAIDPQSYPTPSKADLDKWQQQLGRGFVLFIGMLRHYKGLNTLIEAAKQLNIAVVIAGAGPLEQELQAQAAGLSNVHFLGRVDEADKMALYQLCGMVVLPSHTRAEAFGICLLEGLMHKKPLISTELGTGTSYVNQHEQTGFVIEPGNATALVHAIQALQNEDLALKMGEAGYAWFLQEFQSAIMGQRYYQLYQRLLS